MRLVDRADSGLLCAGAQHVVGYRIGTDTLRKVMGLFRNPIGNLPLTSFKSSLAEWVVYIVLNETLKSRYFPAFSEKAM